MKVPQSQAGRLLLTVPEDGSLDFPTWHVVETGLWGMNFSKAPAPLSLPAWAGRNSLSWSLQSKAGSHLFRVDLESKRTTRNVLVLFCMLQTKAEATLGNQRSTGWVPDSLNIHSTGLDEISSMVV